MTELKTLKDIEFGCAECEPEDIKPLRQEAIKWVNELKSNHNFDAYYKKEEAIIYWIKQFFNITDEELK